MVVAAFNQEKALVGAFSEIVQLHRLIDLRHYLRCFHLEEHLPVEQLIVAGDEVPPVAAVQQLRLLGLGLCNTGSDSHSIVMLLELSTTLLEVPQLTVYPSRAFSEHPF